MTLAQLKSRVMAPVRPGQSLKTRVTLSTLLIFLASLWSLSYYASQMLRRDLTHLLSAQQFSTVSVVASSINADLSDRIQSLELVAQVVDARLLQQPAALQKYLNTLIVLQAQFNAGVRVVGPDGVALADVSEFGRMGMRYADNEAVAEALAQGQTRVGRPFIAPLLRQPVFSIAVVIRNEHSQVIGALVGDTNLGKANFLDKMTQAYYGRTGGYLLVAPRSRQVVTATERSRAMEALTPPGVDPLLDRFMQGYEGSGLTQTPEGAEVLTSVKGVPATGWFVAAALPASEAFAPIVEMQQRMLLATLVLTLLAGSVSWWILRRQLAPMLEAANTLAGMSETQQPVHPLSINRPDEIGQLIGGFNRLLATLAQRTEALKESERKLSDILENVDAYIYLKDTQGRYLFANRPLRDLFGVSMAGLIGQRDSSFFTAESVAQLRHNDRLVLQEGNTLKTDEINLQRLDGGSSTLLTVKLPLRNEAGEIYALCGISTDITERQQAEEALRIAAIAFECQEGIVVMDAELTILRVNRSFTRITGYAPPEVQGQGIDLLRSGQHPATFYAGVWQQTKREGGWQGEMWQQRKNGDAYPARITITAVRDERDLVTHYVGNLTDATSRQLQEQQRLLSEAAHRNVLVREVHHRIKNNLQGITGILRQFAQKHPATAEPIRQAISQVQGISVIHGLQGRSVTSSVRLCELTAAIAGEIEQLWQTPLLLDIAPLWTPCVLAEKEAVPIALVLNELMLNAVKHGGQAQGGVQITLRKGDQPDVVQITITNSGQLGPPERRNLTPHHGLQLIAALMPRSGARLQQTQQDAQVLTLLELQPPVISLDQKEPA